MTIMDYTALAQGIEADIKATISLPPFFRISIDVSHRYAIPSIIVHLNPATADVAGQVEDWTYDGDTLSADANDAGLDILRMVRELIPNHCHGEVRCGNTIIAIMVPYRTE